MATLAWIAVLIAVSAAQPVFNATFSSNMVLQQAPSKAAVYGTVDAGAALKVSVSGSGSYEVTATVTGTQWLAYLQPAKAGGDYTVTVTCTSGCTGSANISSVTFGDVWYCAGQSNMWLPLLHTMSRNDTVSGIQAGKYDNIRLMAGDSQHSPSFPWVTAKASLAGGNVSVPTYPLFDFSAACWYFAESLTDMWTAAGTTPIPLGLINTAIGGSMIEEWSLNTTTATCKNASIAAHNQILWDSQVVPYLSMTVKGWLWYQGENNCHGTMGNSATGTGYGCQMPAMVAQWRKFWSAVPGTTDPLAPFGVVTLAAGTSEGGPDIGGMRWSQTANYGVLPNSAMPNTFLAQGFDLGDMWPSKTCYSWQCCWNNYNATSCNRNTQGNPTKCDGYCTALRNTNFYMGPIHPRDKKPVGERLARAAYNSVYGGAEAFTGPTISGCAVSGDKLTIKFNSTLLRGDAVSVSQYNTTAVNSGLRVITNMSNWGSNEPTVWMAVNIALQDGAVQADLSPLNGTAIVGFRYAWEDVQGSCCVPSADLGVSVPCPLASCPIMGSKSQLPANPFQATIVNGKCQCVAPQVCDE